MKYSWVSQIFFVAFLLLLGHSDSYVIKRTDDLVGDIPSWVFRGDMRTPTMIKETSGFWPRMTPKELLQLDEKTIEKAYSLYYHHTGRTADITQYISTTTDPVQARKFATPFRQAQINEPESGYIYRISADQKMIDLKQSLGPENMIEQYIDQEEYATVGGIPYEQIEGWYYAADIGGPELESLRAGKILENLFMRNPDFDLRYLKLRASGAQHQLSGFPNPKGGGKANRQLKKVLKTKPWSDYHGKSVRTAYEEFSRQVAPELDAMEIPQFPATFGEIAAFTEADPLGLRDLIGALELEAADGLVSPVMIAASEAGTLIAAKETILEEELIDAVYLDISEVAGASSVAEGLGMAGLIEEILLIA